MFLQRTCKTKTFRLWTGMCFQMCIQTCISYLLMSTLLTPLVRWRHENGPSEGRLMVHPGQDLTRG